MDKHDEHWWSRWMEYDRTKKYRYCMKIGCNEVEYREAPKGV